MGINIPNFGKDLSKVSAYAPLGQGLHVTRIFLPLPTRLGDLYMPWTDLANEKGVTLTAHTSLNDLLPQGVDIVSEPRAQAGGGVIPVLLKLAAEHLDIHDQCVFVRWIGYAESGDDADELALRGSHIGPWQQKEFTATFEPLAALDHVENAGLHLPTHIWTPDHSFILTCPMFSDSLYLSSVDIDAERLISEGLEAAPIDEDLDLPIIEH